MTTYAEFAQLPRSQKITLAVIRAVQRVKNFTFVSGSTWTRVTPYYVSNVTGAPFTYDPITSTLTITSAANPNTLNLIVEYSFFMSDFPVNRDVEYQPRLIDIGALKLELDTENTGIAIETDSSIKLENTDGYFDAIFDTLTWENQLCEFYSWSQLIPWSEKKLIYRGYINTKTFSTGNISFSLKDSFVKLRDVIPFTGQRLIYGKAKNLDTVSLDQVGTGFALTGLLSGRNDRDLLTGGVSATAGSSTITGLGTLFTTELTTSSKIRVIDGILEYSYSVSAIGSDTSLTISGTVSAAFAGATCRNSDIANNIITGSGTTFLSQVSPDDELTINLIKYKVASIESDTSLTISDAVKTAFTSLTATNLPSIAYRQYNRNWNVSGHQLASYTTTISNVISQRLFEVPDISHIYDGDAISIGSDFYTVSRVSGNKITINQNAVTPLAIGQTVFKPSIQGVYLNGSAFVHGRDYTETNTSTGCKVVFNTLAEFNCSSDAVSSVSLSFVVGSRVVTSLSNAVDLTGVFSPRDWIKAYSGSTTTWYEILQVTTLNLTLRTAYTETRNFSGPAQYRKPTYIADDSPILVDCMGKLSSGVWVKTASDAVKDLCQLVSIPSLDTASFYSAKIDAPYCLSLVYPSTIGGKMPVTRDAILSINKSVFGSLYSNSNFEIAYSILNADRDTAFSVIDDSDIINFSTSTKNQITNNVVVTYRNEVGTSTKSTYSFLNTNLAGITTELDLDLCLYDLADATIIAQRYAFLRSCAQTTVTINGKLNLIDKTLNSRVYLGLTRLFKRFGSSGSVKVGLVNMISKTSAGVSLQINDLGNMFSRVGSITPNTANDFSSATDIDKSLYTYICDNNNETPDATSDESLGANLIG